MITEVSESGIVLEQREEFSVFKLHLANGTFRVIPRNPMSKSIKIAEDE